MTRTYDMRRRSRAAEDTRARIIAAAQELLDRSDGARLSLLEVAAAANVTRATVYNRVGSRRDLLRAVLTDQGRLIDFNRVLNAMELEDPAECVIQTVRESCRAWAVKPGAIRSTLALAATDPEVRELVKHYERSRRSRLAGVVRSVADAGGLRPGVSETDALARFTLVTSFQAYDHMILQGSHEEAIEQLTRMAASAFRIPLPGTGG